MPSKTFFNLSEETRNRIIDAAYDEYLNNPYEKVNIRNLVKRANIPIGSFYRYFENKNDIYFYLHSVIIDKQLKDEKFIEFYEQNFYDNKEVLDFRFKFEESLEEREIEFLGQFYTLPIDVIRIYYFDFLIEKIGPFIKKILQKKIQGREIIEDLDIDFFTYFYITSIYNIFCYTRDKEVDIKEKIEKQFRALYNKFLFNSIE